MESSLLMANGTVRLKGGAIHDKLRINMHELALEGRVSYPTVHKYLRTPEKLNSFSADVLYTLIVDGMGLTPSEAECLTIGDIFDFVAIRNSEAE